MNNFLGDIFSVVAKNSYFAADIGMITYSFRHYFLSSVSIKPTV